MEVFMDYEIATINFREVCMGGIAPKWLYRSSHPVTCGELDFGMTELAQRAGIAAVLNLVDDEKALSQKAPLVPWYHKLFLEGRIIALDMNFNVFGDQFSGKINRGVKFIIDTEGPYLIHCMQGIDRTGFFVMLLGMMMGADKEEIVDNYMASFLGRPGFEKGAGYYKQERSYFIAVLKRLNGGGPIKNSVLLNIAEKYLLENAGLTRFGLDRLRAQLSKSR
jgi:hypothetical protein